jgi:hypothetical protein
LIEKEPVPQNNESISSAFAPDKSSPIAAESAKIVAPSIAVSTSPEKNTTGNASSSLSDEEFSKLIRLYKGSDKVELAEYETTLSSKLKGSSPALPSESVAESFANVEKAPVPAESIATSFIKTGSSAQSESITSDLASPKQAEPTPASTIISQSTQEKPAVQAELSSVVAKGKQISSKEDSQKSEKNAAPAKPAEILDKEKTEPAKKESTKPGFFSKIKSEVVLFN